MFLFQPSDDPRVPLDASGYRCLVWERHSVEVVCQAQQPPPCFMSSSPLSIPCLIGSNPDPLFIWQGIVSDPAPGQVVYGCVEAVLPSGATSECWGEFP